MCWAGQAIVGPNAGLGIARVGAIGLITTAAVARRASTVITNHRGAFVIGRFPDSLDEDANGVTALQHSSITAQLPSCHNAGTAQPRTRPIPVTKLSLTITHRLFRPKVMQRTDCRLMRMLSVFG